LGSEVEIVGGDVYVALRNTLNERKSLKLPVYSRNTEEGDPRSVMSGGKEPSVVGGKEGRSSVITSRRGHGARLFAI
jgi:hypothetical protein